MNKLISVFLKGMAMGAADIVPGVSGGTIALITGIYEELINSLKSVTPAKIMLLFKQGPKAFWSSINGTFLSVLLLGIVTSLISLSHALSFLIREYPTLIWSFFFGLVLASGLWLLRQCQLRSLVSQVSLFVGIAIAFMVTSGRPLDIEATPFMLFISGALAICAMILPGISGSFILLLLGVYTPVLLAIKSLDWGTMLIFAAGCGTGLLSFVHLLSFLLNRFHAIALASLTGFLFGSLNALWPWKKIVETYTSSKGLEKPLVQQNVWPTQFEVVTGQDSMWVFALMCLALGCLIVFLLEK